MWITPFLWSFLFLCISVWSVYNRCRLCKAVLLGNKNLWLQNLISFWFFAETFIFLWSTDWLVSILLDLIHICTNWLLSFFSILVDTFLTIKSTSLLTMLLLLWLQRNEKETGAILSLNRNFQKLVCIGNSLFVYWEDLLNSLE